MLQPKRREQLDSNIQELLKNGGSNEDVEQMAKDFTAKFGNEKPTPQKKNPNQGGGSIVDNGSLVFPKAPKSDFEALLETEKQVEKPAKVVAENKKAKTFRLPNYSDEQEMQRRGITPPPSEMLKKTAKNTKDIYDLDNKGDIIPEKPNQLLPELLKKQDKSKGFYQLGEENAKRNIDIENGFSEKPIFEFNGGKLIYKTNITDFKTSEGIDKEIENNDLNLDHPYLYYSTFDKENQSKDNFIQSNFGEDKLAGLGINTADFDGFLNKKGYKAEYLDKEANGLFEGKGSDLTGGYNIQLAKEMQKQRLLDLYMQDINSRDFARRKLNQEKVNLGKSGADREKWTTQYTLFDSAKVGEFYEKEMPILTQKLKERDAENFKIYETHKNGDAGFFYGTKQVLISGWNGFLDRINQTSSTLLDKIGLDSGADELRLLNEERQIQRPNTRDVGYASGKTTNYNGVNYLVTKDGQIIDQDKEIRVTDLFDKSAYDAIVNQSKSGKEDSVFSFQGSGIQLGGVLGDMIVQVALQRGLGVVAGATVKAGGLLSKIPMSKGMSSAIITQSALGYSQGLEQTYKAAIDAGIDEKTAKVLAADASQRMAVLYAITAPLSPQTKAIQAIFGSEGKELIKKAIASYAVAGKKGFVETLKGGIKVLAKKGATAGEEGLKEVFQENIQQTGEQYGVNASVNRDAGRELLKETISADEFVNTSILSFGAGSLMTLPDIFSSTDKLKTLQQLSQDPIAFEKNLKELVAKEVFTNDKADVLRKDVKVYSNQSNKIPKNLNKDIAMDVMSDLQDISDLESKKKGLDKSFHKEIDAEIEVKRTGIRDRISFEGLSKKEISKLKETASEELIAEAKEQGKKEFSFDNKQITERANVIYAKQVKEGKQYNDIWVRNEKDIPTGPDRNPNDRYNVVTNSEELKIFDEQEKAKQTPTTPEAKPQRELGKIEEKNGTFYVTDENGVTKGFATKEAANAHLVNETKVSQQNEDGSYGFNKPKTEALKDVESTTKALEATDDKEYYKAFNSFVNSIKFRNVISDLTSETIAKAYHKSKAEGTNPNFVKAVEKLIVNSKTQQEQSENEKLKPKNEAKNMDEFYKIHAELYSVTDKANEDYRSDKITTDEYNSILQNEESKRDKKLNELKDKIGDNEYDIVSKNAKINWYENSIAESEKDIKDIENKKNPTEKDLVQKKNIEEYLERNKQGLTKAKEELEVLKAKQTPKPQEASPVEDIVATGVSKEEYNDFIDNNKVSDERLNSIANKVKNKEKLSEKENAIFVGKTSEINKIIANAKEDVVAPELDIKIERGGVFSGEFLNDYDFLAEGSEHTVYRSKDGKTVIKIGEPYNSNETYQARVDDAIAINRLLGDGSLEVIGTYKSPNGTINPVYRQNFTDGKTATQEQVAEHLINNGFTQTGRDTFTINKDGKTLEISDTSDNFIINANGDIIAIDASIREIKTEATPATEPTDEELLNDLEDNEDTSTKNVDAIPEITAQEYLDFVENDFLSDERLNDIAVKVRENKDLTAFEKRIANKKEKEILGINKKVQDEVNETNRKAEVDTLSKIPVMEKDEFIEYTNSEKASPERLTAIAYKKANNVELNNFEKEVYQDNKKVVDKINKDKNLQENILDKIPTEQKYQTKEGKYTVAKNGKELDLYDTNGQPVKLSPKTKQKYFLEALENGFMKRNEELQYPDGLTAAEVERFELENETDPSLILEKLQTTEVKLDGATASDFKDFAIASYINKVTQSSFNRFGDKNNITRGIALTYFSKQGQNIDTLAQEISESMDIEVTPQDIVDFILANPNGKRNILTVKNPDYQNLIDKFVELTGFAPTPSQIMDFKTKGVSPIQIDIEFANEVEVNDEIDDDIIDKVQTKEKFDNWFLSLTPQEQIEFYFDLEENYPNAYYQQRYNEQQEYEQSKEITSTGTPNRQGETKLDDSVGPNAQQDRPGSENDNLPGRNSGEIETKNGEQGNSGTGSQGVKPFAVGSEFVIANQRHKIVKITDDRVLTENLDDAYNKKADFSKEYVEYNWKQLSKAKVLQNEAEAETEFKTEYGAKLKGKAITIKGMEGLDLILVKNGMITEVYELASGRPLASSNELTEKAAIEDIKNNFGGKVVNIAEKIHSSIYKNSLSVNPSPKYQAYEDNQKQIEQQESANRENKNFKYTEEERSELQELLNQYEDLPTIPEGNGMISAIIPNGIKTIKELLDKRKGEEKIYDPSIDSVKKRFEENKAEVEAFIAGKTESKKGLNSIEEFNAFYEKNQGKKTPQNADAELLKLYVEAHRKIVASGIEFRGIENMGKYPDEYGIIRYYNTLNHPGSKKYIPIREQELRNRIANANDAVSEAPISEVESYKKGDVVIWGGEKKTIKSMVKMGNDMKFEIDLGDGKSIWTNGETLDKESKAEPKQSKRKVRDEKVDEKLSDAFKELRDELGKIMMGINPELAIKASKIIAIYTKAGIYKLSDIIEDAYEKFGEISKEMFDALKSGYASYYATAEDSIADQMDSNVRIFTYETLIDKLKNDEQAEQPIEQPITDTKPIELKTKAIESKTDKLANDREAKVPTERKLEIANDLLFDIDTEIENVNDQLRLLGFYEPNANDEMRENPHIYIERELKKDLTNFVKKLNERLKWDFDVDKKGKPIYASANVAPAGGDGTFILWAPNSEYGIYVSLSVQPKEYKEWYEQYELEPTIMWRVTTKKDKYRGLSNQWMNSEDFTIPNLVDKFTKATNFYLKQENGSNNQQPAGQGISNPIAALQPNSKRPSETAPQELLQKPSAEPRTGSRSQPTSNPISGTNSNVGQSTTGQGDLFSGNAPVLEQTPPKDKVEVQIEQINQAEKQEPALVDFAMQDNEQEKFNATKKYTDNINALETLLTVIKGKRKATSEEKNILAKYVGFGGLKEIAFNPDNEADWKESTTKYKDQVRKVMQLTQELDQALGINNSLSEIRAGILTAHYTPKTIIDTMFNVLGQLGFQNGNILEPSAGIGNFIGYMPSKMRSNSKINAVELDNVTGSILKYLYDDVNTQIKGIQDAIIPDNSQDVVISNVPFGNFRVFDKAFKGNREFLTKRIHNYFFAKALDKVREGGIVMFVTSKGILDSKGNQNVREYLNQNADFLGAVRLPSTAFQNNANTSVVTDVIILRKNTTGEKNNPNFLDVVDLEVTDKNGEVKTITINTFFKENRNVLLGDIVPGGMYSEKDYSLADPDNKMGQMGERVSLMLEKHKGTFQPITNVNATNRIETNQDLLENTKIGNLTISSEGKILKRVDSEMQEVAMPSYVKPRNVKKYIDVRVALFDLITAEYTGQPDSVLDGLRTKLNSLYLNAVQSIPAKEFNRIATEDGDGFNVLSLTDKSGKRADILSKRTINPLKQKQNTDNVEEAIIISLYENAHVDMNRIAELMNKPVKEILELAKGKIFESPTGGFFTRDEYLSGNVKKKLAEVNKAIESGYPEFENNKAELEVVIPKDIPAVSIEVRLGSRWVPLDIINDFADHLFKDDGVVINYAKSTDTYNNNGKSLSVNATEKWGTKRKNGADLLIDALHAATPAIYDTIDDKRVLNKEETEKAVQKFEEIRAEFENWVYTNAERRERLGEIYNEKYNTTVRRKYDGSHLNIPGINGVNLYPHQKDAIWMLLQNNGGIIDHIVGAGKTFVMVAGTAEMKRTGVAKKPMILALKSTIPQIVETYKQSYPLAKILAPSEKDFQAKNRQKLFSQISLNDWDVIIMSHENFNAIPHRIEYLTKQIDDEIAEIEEERDALSGDKKALSGLETRIKNLQARLEKLTDIAKDNSVKFQEMGIDHIMVDESQQFKNLAYMTKQRNVAGLSKAEGSRRAFNLLVGMRYLQDVFGADKGTTFLSGTPISNSMVEMYSLLKYMRPNKMKELGFNTFDQWATTFASPTNEVEYTVTGQFKSKTRFREFINVPELSLLYNEIADVRNDSNLVLDKPTMKGGGYTTMFIPMNEEQADYGQRIIQFAKTKDGAVLGLTLSENQLTAYMLLATNLSSKMAIDMRLINKDYAYDPNGKVGKMTDEAVKVYTETNEHKGVQLIFSDLGTPKNKNNQSEMLKDYMEDELGVPQDTLVEIFGNFAEEGHKYQPMASIKQKAIDVLEIEESDFEDYIEQAKQSGETFNLYSEIKKRLIEKGIPENEIVFIHSYNNQKAKEKLFEQVNNGEIRVVLGSTQKLGTGVNVQKRLAAIHHLDVPWRPSDMEQRNGRGVRQGNWIAKTHLNNEIAVYAYATERTLDGYKYQLLQTKQRFLDQVKNGDIEDRVIKENSEEGSDAYAIFVAELSGNKDILLKFKLEQEKERLTKQRRNFEGSLYEAQGNIKKLESNIPVIEENANKTKQDIESIANKAVYDVTKDEETGIETKKLKIDNINGEVLQPEKDSKEAKEKKPADRTEYGKKAIELIAQTVKTAQLGEFKKSFEINGLPILVKVSNQREFSNGREFMIQKTVLAILSPTGQTYTVNNSTIAGVLLNNIQKAIESIPIALEMQEKVLEKNKKDLIEYKELAKNDKFPKEEELSNVAAELKEIDKRIQDFEKDVEEDLENNDINDNFVNDESEQYKTRLDIGGTMENRAISSMVGEPKTRRDLYKTIQASNNGGSVSPDGTIEDIEELESRGLNPYWDRKIFKSKLKEEAIKNNLLLPTSYLSELNLIHDKRKNLSAENDVYLNNDGTTITKVNDLSYVIDGKHHQNLNSFFDRIYAHNSLFPNATYKFKGFIINKHNEISVVLEQPFINSVENSTQEEIDQFLANNSFVKSGKREWSNAKEVWTNGEFELFDARPANVLKDKNGELYFIDTFPHSVEYLQIENSKLKLNKTQDGQDFLSLSEPGTEYSNSSQPNLWQQGDRDSGENNRRSVQAVWTKYKNLQFKGTTKIQSAEDVAKIMSLLENKHNEHAFAIHIDQKGNSHIQFLSIGGVTGTVVDSRLITAGVSKFNSVKVYLVHNHPSGKMQPSDADMRVTKNLRDGLNPLGITVEHIIMDTYLKQYIHIDNDNLFTVNTRGENTFTKSLTPVDLSEQEILGEHFGTVTSSDKAFSIIQNFRFSAMPKNAMLVMNNSNQVIGNYVFSNGDITFKEILTFIGDTATATSVIFYGNQANNLSDVKDFKRDLAKLDITVFDKIVTSSDNEAVEGYYKSMADTGMLNEHHEQYGTGNQKFQKYAEPVFVEGEGWAVKTLPNKYDPLGGTSLLTYPTKELAQVQANKLSELIAEKIRLKDSQVNEPSSGYSNKDLRLPQTIARQALDQMKQDRRNNVDKNTMLKNAVSLIQNSDWYQNLDNSQQARVNNTTVKSLLENAIKEINYLEDKIEDYKQQLKDNKITSRQVFDDIIAFLKTNQIKGKITPTEINRLIKGAAQITIRKDTAKALDDFMKLYEVIKEKALLRSDKGAREKAEVDYVVPIVEMLVESGYELEAVLDYFETDSQKRMAEIQYHKEKAKYATVEERINKVDEALEKQKQDLFNATYTSFREGLKKARLYWFNLISDRSYVPANLISKTGMQQTYYQFKNTKGYGHSAKEMYERAYDKVWKGLTRDKIELLNDVIQMMRIITIDNNREQNGLAPVQHPNNLSNTDAKTWLQDKKDTLGAYEFSDIKKRAEEYFKAYQEVLDLKLENGFISQETYDALNGLDYQPRMFLHHAVNFDGDLSFEQKQHIILRSGLSKEQVKSLEDGSANSLILDAQWLLSNSISSLYQDIADNNLNRLFIAEEFPIAKEKYDDLLTVPTDQLTKEEQRFVKYFKELSDKVIPNSIIGFNANTNDPIYKDETPKGFVNKYYWADGVKHQFFMEENLAQQFDGAKGLFLNESNKATVGNITGSRIVKYFATGNNPLFVIVNTPRDFMWNILVSEHYSTVVPIAMAQMTYQLFPSTYDFIRTKLGRENTDMNLYLQHGGSMDYLHKQGQIASKSFADKYIVKTITSVAGKNNQPRVEDAIKNNYLSKGIGALNEWSELAFRIATFRRSINASLKELGFNNESEITDLIDENGAVTQTRQEILDNIYRKATYDARSILDFSQGGRLVKDMEEFMPYLNVGVQATRSYADAMKKRPISTTLKTLQIATGGAAAFIALAMFMLAGDDDEPEEEAGKTSERKYIEFMQGVSEETRSKYYLIPTKNRDEKGNRIAYKIAKDQFMIPYTNFVETLMENKIRTRAGYKEIGWDKIGTRLYRDIFEYNLSLERPTTNSVILTPLEMTAGKLKDVPLFKAGVAAFAGYDLYRDKPLDKYAKSNALEGMDNPQVEDFYKQLGAQWKISPIRTKSAIESMITSPQSNPYLATGYEVMDYALTDKSMSSLGSGVKEMLLKGLKNRTTTKSTEWTRTENLLQDTKDQQFDAMLKEEATRQLFKDKAEEIFDEKITDKAKLYKKYSEAKKELKLQYGDDPNYDSYRKSFKTKFTQLKKAAETDAVMEKIKKEKSPGARAIMIEQVYGDINSPENAKLKLKLKKNGVINSATKKYLNEE